MKIAFKGKPLRVLDFDVETRPLSFLGSDFTTDEITAISAAWVVNGKPRGQKTWLLGKDNPKTMLREFRAMYAEAGLVCGHYIRNFDLPMVNGAMLEYGLPPLDDKLTSCTKNDLGKRRGISVSQENLGALLKRNLTRQQLEFYEYLDQKVQMNTPLWRTANRLEPGGIQATRRRVQGDVKQHIQLRERLLEIGWLSRPRVWKSSTGVLSSKYVP